MAAGIVAGFAGSGTAVDIEPGTAVNIGVGFGEFVDSEAVVTTLAASFEAQASEVSSAATAGTQAAAASCQAAGS